MTTWFRSLVKRRPDSTVSDDDPSPATQSDTATATEDSAEEPRADTGRVDFDTVLADLRGHISANSADPLPVKQIDPEVHMYDAGYVNSISSADLLVHIKSRYGLLIRETDLVGSLYCLDALSKHIVLEAT